MYRTGLACMALALCPVVALAQSDGEPAAAPYEHHDVMVELTPESEQAIRDGLRFLAQEQLPNGAWHSHYGTNVGVVSLALLSFLSAGHVPYQGEFADVVERGLDWLLLNAQPSGLIHYADAASHGPMYEHALATLALSEALGMSERPELASAVQAAVRVIVNAQNEEGGWRYQPFSRDADVSASVMQILALRGAQTAGMQVPAHTIQQAVRYVKSCAHRGGGFVYQAGAGEPNFARTGAGVCSLQVCGEYEAEEVQRGLDYLLANIGQDTQMEHYHYGVYYAAQAVYQAKDARRWQEWFPPIREQVLGFQQPDGSWQSDIGPAYGTATMVLTLAIPYRYLPIYQR